MADSVVKGMPELAKYFETFPDKFKRNTARRALRRGANIAKAAAKQNIHSVSGELAKGLRVGTRSKGDTVWAYVKAKGPHAFIAGMVERGTRAHFIAAKNAKSLRVGSMAYRAVHHPGAKPHPFLRPALDTRQGAIVAAVQLSIKADLETKGGLDLADINIEEA